VTAAGIKRKVAGSDEASWSLRGKALTIHVPPISYMEHRGDSRVIINIIEDTVVSHPDAPSVAAVQLAAARRSRISG
jgi:hypothetical protein